MSEEELMEKVFPHWIGDTYFKKTLRLKIFDSNSLLQGECSINFDLYPIVDTTYGVVIETNSAHRTLMAGLGFSHGKDCGKLIHDQEDAINFFLKEHGYYWSWARGIRY